MGQNMGQEVLCRNTKIISKLFEQKAKEKVLKSVDFRTIYGIPTVRGYNAPCFEGMVHYCMGSVLIAPGQ